MSADYRFAGPDRRAAGLIAVAEDLAGEFELRPPLERILLRCTELPGCPAGSICSVDEAAGTYRKEADIGVACQSGRVFPLTEGMTGVVVARRAPVWFDRYEQVRGGHVTADDRATLRGVIGVPLEWRDRLLGLASSPLTWQALEGALAAAMKAGALGCVDLAADGPELARAVIAAGRGQAFLSAPVLARLRRGLRAGEHGPVLTERERQVRALMEQGLPDKVIAERLVLSVKTVEKHAGAVLRKTGARNRTELAAHAARADGDQARADR